MTDYSVCMLCYNDSENLRKSLDSVLELGVAKSLEVIVVDNRSADSSPSILREYARKGLIKAVGVRCSRGVGRQIALENATGRYVLAHMDCDDVFSAKGICAWIDMYHEHYEDLMIMSKREHTDANSNVTIAPRELFLRLGWRDLNWYEDWDLWNRALSMKRYMFVKYPEDNPLHRHITVRVARRRGAFSRNRMTFGRYRDAYKIGRPPFRSARKVPFSQMALFSLAKLATDVTRSRLVPVEFPLFRY